MMSPFNYVPIRPIVAYLVPATLGALILARWRRANLAFALLSLLGTLAHELLHFIIGFLAFARPVRLSLWPHRAADGSYCFGMVVFENLRWWNAAPASLAPLLGYAIAPSVAWLRVRHGFQLSAWDAALWFALAQLMLAAWPSSVDWRLSLRSWPFALIAIAVVLFRYAQG
jgi:hypothetical protein